MGIIDRIRPSVGYAALAVISFAVMQAIVVVMHEFTHSTVAWALGQMQSPLGIVWGNPLTVMGWDEGVDYKRIFAAGQFTMAAMIGVSPLVMHTAIVTSGLLAMRKGRPANKCLFYILFWFVVAHFMELIAYIAMRPFATSGDVGIFNRGMMLSPWMLFIGGSAVIAAGVRVLFGEVVPRLCAMFAKGDRLLEWTILVMGAFALFLWGSGLRVMVFVYPDPQWLFGLLGPAAFFLVAAVYRPGR